MGNTPIRMIQTFSKMIGELVVYLRGPSAVPFYTGAVFMAVPTALALIFAPAILKFAALLTFLGALWVFASIILETSHIRSKEQLETRELSSLIDYLPDGVIVYDTSYKVLNFNKAAQNLFKLAPEEIVGRAMDPGFSKNAHLRVFIQTLFPSLAPGMTQISGTDVWPQIVDLTTDEPVLELRTTLIRLVNEQGTAVGFVRLVKDRTREKALLAEKADFINVAAHQLRTPLTAMGWAMESLTALTEDSSSEIKEIVLQGSDIAQRALKITNDLLDVAKIEEGKFGFSFQKIDLAPLLQNLVSASTSVASHYSVSIYLEPVTDAPIWISADPAKLSSVVLNLLDNAIKYNVKNGKVVVAATRLLDSPFVKVTVEDTGIGIPPEDTKGMFSKLHRASNAAATEPNGSGLGLYIAKNIIEKHGGQVGFDSTLNRGSVFWFTLPLTS